jgi:hypothetical protein
MDRAQRAFSALAGGVLVGSMLLTSGCASTQSCECNNGGWFSRFRLASRIHGAPGCECEGGMSAGGDVVVPPNAFMPPGAMMAPTSPIVTAPPTGGQPPRIIPVPQAQPMPFTGQP